MRRYVCVLVFLFSFFTVNDSFGQSLFGIFSLATGDRQMGTIDAATGATTLIGSPIDGTSISTSANTTYDHSGDRILFAGDPFGATTYSVYAVNTGTGAATSVVLSGASTSVAGIEYDEGETTLYAMFNTGGPRRPGTINITTGVTVFIGAALSSGVNVSSSSGVIALDIVGNRLFFVGTPTSGSESIYTTDTGTGLSTAQALSTGGVTGMEYDGDSGTLFGLFSVAGDRQLGTIDPTNGTVVLLGSPIGSESISSSSGVNCIDFSGNRFFFIGDPSSSANSVFTAATATGSATSAVLAGASTSLMGIEFPAAPFPVELQYFAIE